MIIDGLWKESIIHPYLLHSPFSCDSLDFRPDAQPSVTF
jgi:hypothetical protein